MIDPVDVAAHPQTITHNYVVHYPEHPARTSDPNYVDFEAYARANKPTAKCAFWNSADSDQCTLDKPLELHHKVIEFSLQNGIDLAWLETDYPGISDPNSVGAWVESANNLEVLCRSHHRSYGGVHASTASDFEAEKYVKNLISKKGVSDGNTSNATSIN
jgi:hypothetical protein